MMVTPIQDALCAQSVACDACDGSAILLPWRDICRSSLSVSQSATRDPSEPGASSSPQTDVTDAVKRPSVSPSSAPPVSSNEVVVRARAPSSTDPMEKLNAQSFALTEGFDKAFLGPVSIAYARTIPQPVQDGIANFLSNLREPVVFVNYLLQLKPGKAAETVGRFVINSTTGVGGFFDIAKRRPFRLPHRPNGFADTMGYYGVKPGPYLFLPLMGPSTPRDLAGFVLDRLVLPLSVGKPFNRLSYTLPTSVANALDRRAAFQEKMDAARASGDPYVARRTYYLSGRQAEIDALHTHRTPATEPPSKPRR